MEAIKIWAGRKGARNGCDCSNFEVIEFRGTELGWQREGGDSWDNRGVDYGVYQTEEGTILIHRIVWSRWVGEDTVATVLTFDSLDEAVKAGWRNVLENAGVIPRRVRSLREWRAEREQRGDS